MHDLMCCESPLQPLAVNDMSCVRGKVFVGPICVLLNPNDTIPNSVEFACKSSQTLLGMLSYQLANFSSLSSSSENSGVCLPVDVSTCLVSCCRCGQYLGDAQLMEDEDSVPICSEVTSEIFPQGSQPFCCPTHRKPSNVLPETEVDTFNSSDVRTIKFQFDRICWKSSALQSNVDYTTEIVFARAMLFLSQIHRISQFRFSVEINTSTSIE